MQVYTTKKVQMLIKKLNINVSGLARELKMKQSTLNSKIKGERPFKNEELLKITLYFKLLNL